MRFNRLSLCTLIVLTMTASLALSGCKSEEGATAGDNSAEGGGVAKADAKVFNHFRTTAEKSLDPMAQFDSASAAIISNVYDTLLEYHYLKRPYQLSPNLLESMPTLSEDGLTYTFKLRKGITFVDNACFPGGKGRELNADDVIYSIKRFSDANINTNSYPVLLKDRILGLDAFRDETRKNKKMDYSKSNVEGLKKVDSHTFTVTLKKKDPLALMPFASSPLSIIPKEAVDKYGEKFGQNPVGTGPFVMKTFSRRGKIVLAKNPNYHGKFPTEGQPEDKEVIAAYGGKQLPFVDTIELPLIEGPQPAMLKFRSGQIDWIGIDKDNFVKMATKDPEGNFTLKDEYAKQFDMYTALALVTSYKVFNMKDPLLGKNKALRQAFTLSMDTAAFIEKMRNGRGAALNSIVPLEMEGSERDSKAKWYATNIEEAKKKLVEAGYPNGEGLPAFSIEYRATTSDTRQSHEFYRAELAKVGIKLKGNFQTFSAFLKKIESGNFQLADAGWAADYPDGENFFQLLYSPNKAPGPNEGSYVNEEYDKLYVETKAMAPSPERNAKFGRMAEILKEDVPIFNLWNPVSFGMYQKWVGGMKRNMMVDAPYKYLDIKMAKKKKGIQK